MSSGTMGTTTDKEFEHPINPEPLPRAKRKKTGGDKTTPPSQAQKTGGDRPIPPSKGLVEDTDPEK